MTNHLVQYLQLNNTLTEWQDTTNSKRSYISNSSNTISKITIIIIILEILIQV